MGFLDDIFKGDKKKGGNTTGGGGGGGLQNPFGGPRTFHGQGQSLGGSKPGRVIQITLSNPGPLGVRVEKRPNSGGTAIVNTVVAGSQAEAAGMKRGDILCFAGSNGQEEMMYEMFLDLAKSEQRPIHIEIRRIDRELKKQHKTSADVDHRRQAVIAAAEAREKAHKAKSKPLKHITKTTLAKQQQLQEGNLSGEDLNSEVSNEPLTVEAQKAAALAKQGEAQLAAQLGYNPYETARSTAGQARTATTVATHGTITAPNHAGENLPTLPTVDPPREAAIPEEESSTEVDFPAEYTDAYAIMVSSNEASTVKSSCAIMRKLLINATTKGQTPGDDAAKFRKVRLANKKIKAAIVDVPGAVELMLSTGFYVAEQDGESVLIFPADFPGPDWLPAALKHLE